MASLRAIVKHREHCLRHAKKRFLKRYGRPIETEQILAIEEIVKQRGHVCEFTHKGEYRVCVLRIGKEFIGASILDGEIRTFLPKNAVSRALLLNAC